MSQRGPGPRGTPSASAKPMKLSSTCSRWRAATRRLVNSHCSSRARALSKPSFTGARIMAAAPLARIDSCRCRSRSKAPRRCISSRSLA